jgi:hypothetical protein
MTPAIQALEAAFLVLRDFLSAAEREAETPLLA